MNLVPGISLYNQDRLDDDNFVDNFVARIEMVEVLLNVLRQAAAEGKSEHQVLVGARGMGKTSLLRRLAIAIGRDKRLRKQFIPLRFREEQYNVISLDTFWRNCGEALAEWCEANSDEKTAERIDQAIDSPDWRDAEKAAEAFLGFCAGLGRRPCLLIDNLDLVLDGLSDEGWALRHVLQRRDGPMVIGAASQMLKQGADRDGPFYEFFHPLLLEPLAEAELLSCMHALADRRGESGAKVKVVLAKAPERIRTLYALTGGNPRILSLIYQLMERAETDTIFADLEALLDQVTPFYKARIEEYTGAQQRAIIDAIALNWDPITSSALGEVTGIEVTTISSQLAPLRRDGFIEQVETSGARAGYQLGERFLNIWYLMRHGTRKTRQRLRWLTIFLTKLFSAEELGRMAAEARDVKRCGDWHPDFREAVIEAYGTTRAAATKPLEAGPLGERRTNEGAEAESSDADAMILRAHRHWNNDEFDEAIAVCDEVVGRFGDAAEPSLQEGVAIALVNKGGALRRLNRSEEAIAAYDEVVDRFGDAAELLLQEGVVKALVAKGDALRALDRSEAAVAVYEKVASLFGNATEPSLQERVAAALVGKGLALAQLDRKEEAINIYDEVVGQFGDIMDSSLLEPVASALFNKGLILYELGRSEEAISTYGEVVDRSGDAAETALQELVAKALVNKAFETGELGREDEAIATYDEVVGRFSNASEPSLQDQVARALAGKGRALGRLGRVEESITIYNEIVGRFSGATAPSLQRGVAYALFSKGLAIDGLGRSEEAIAIYDEVVGRIGDDSELSARMLVATALVNKGYALETLDRDEDQIATYEEIVRRFQTATEPLLQKQGALALGKKGHLLFDAFARYREAETCYREALAINPNLMDAANLAWSLIAQKCDREAEEARDALTDIDKEGLALINAGIEVARDNLGSALGHLGDALDTGLEPGASAYFEDILWLLRIGVDQGYGEKLIGWFDESGNSDRYAPIYGALVARVRGERFLLDLNPEVRPKASDFYRVLAVTAPSAPAAKGTRSRGKRTRRK